MTTERNPTATRDIPETRPGATGHPRRATVLALMSACVMLVQAMVSGINLAIPMLSASGLHPSSTQLIWIVDIYVIVFAGLLIPCGALGDKFGPKLMLVTGLGVFAAGCLASALAPTVPSLLAARSLAGIGAALLMPATLSLCVQVSSPAERARAVGTWAGATGLGAMLGNVVTGALLEFFPWQVFFAVFAAGAAVMTAVVAFAIPHTERHAARLDPVGSGLLVVAMTTLIFGVIEGRDLGWTSAAVLGSFAAALLLAVAFVAYEWHTEHPLVDPRIFAEPRLRAGALGVLVAFLGLFSLFFVNAQYLQYAKGFTALQTGLALLPQGLCMGVVSLRSAALARRWGARPVVVLGMALIVLGLVLMSLATARTPYWFYLVNLLILATGMGLSTPTLSSGIIASLSHTRSGLGSGINSSVREIGSALGVAITGTVLTIEFTTHFPGAHSASDALTEAARLGATSHAAAIEAFTGAMATGYRVIAIIVAVVTIPVLVWVRERDMTKITAGTGSTSAPVSHPPAARSRWRTERSR